MTRKVSLLSLVLLLGVTAAVQADYESTVLSTNPIAYYRLNDAAPSLMSAVTNAVTPGTLDGTWGVANTAGTEPTVAAGPSGFYGLGIGNTSAEFAGGYSDPNSAVDGIGIASAGAFTNANMTYSFFFRIDPGLYDGDGNRMLTNEDTSLSSNFAIINGGANKAGKIDIGTSRYGDADRHAVTVDTFNDGEWHHLVAIRNGDSVSAAKLYIDGVLVDMVLDSEGFSKDSVSNPAISRIGQRSSFTGWGGFVGGMDEVAVWNRALTDEEALAIYNAAVPEPATLSLLALGGLMLARRRRA